MLGMKRIQAGQPSRTRLPITYTGNTESNQLTLERQTSGVGDYNDMGGNVALLLWSPVSRESGCTIRHRI